MRIKHFLVVIFCVLMPSHLLHAEVLINIDSPNVRKMTAAIPTFYVPNTAQDPEAKNFATLGSQELSRLLNFSGVFSVMAEAGYKETAVAMNQTFLQKDAERSITKPVMEGLFGVDVPAWKGLGIESLTTARVEPGQGGLTVELRTVDVARNQVLLAKRYTGVVKADYIRLIRRYANLIMEAYTGKPGIFSSKIVFVGRRTKGTNKQIFVCDFDGSNVVQITNAKAPHLSPHWSPDGRFVTFTSFRDGNPDLYLYEVATGKRTKLSGQKGLNSGAQWAKSGKLIAFTGSVSGDADIYTITPRGGERKLLIKGEGLDVDPSFSPDGKLLAFVSGRYGNPHIFVASLEWTGDETVRVTGDKRLTFAGWYNANPSFSPDGKKIAFAGFDKDINRFDLFMMNPDGSEMERLTLKRGDNESPSWSPNGQLIVFHSNRDGERDVKKVAQLFMMNKDGSNQLRLETGLYEAQTPEWSGPLF